MLAVYIASLRGEGDLEEGGSKGVRSLAGLYNAAHPCTASLAVTMVHAAQSKVYVLYILYYKM